MITHMRLRSGHNGHLCGPEKDGRSMPYADVYHVDCLRCLSRYAAICTSEASTAQNRRTQVIKEQAEARQREPILRQRVELMVLDAFNEGWTAGVQRETREMSWQNSKVRRELHGG